MSTCMSVTLLGLILASFTLSAVVGNAFQRPALSTEKGCDVRPSCDGSDDSPCGNGTFLPDPCWGQVYYECANGWPVPGICPDPMCFNPISGVCDIFFDEDPHLACGCEDSCAKPPPFPPSNVVHPPEKVELVANEGEEPCNGTILLPHACDCQFYWEYDVLKIAHLRTCGQHSIFSPRKPHSGTCIVIDVRSPENAACLKPKNLVVTFDAVAPVPLPERHPIHELLLKLNIPHKKIPANLLQYTKIKYNQHTVANF